MGAGPPIDDCLSARLCAAPRLPTGLGREFVAEGRSRGSAACKLAALASAVGQPLLGWFVWRPDSALAPSMREQVRSQALALYSVSGFHSPRTIPGPFPPHSAMHECVASISYDGRSRR